MSFQINFKRVFNFALSDFSRNKGISIAAIFILITTTLLFTGLFFLHGISDFLVSTIRDKIDITAYFKSDAVESDILTVRDDIIKVSPDVRRVEYVSKEEALTAFNKRHGESDVISRALSEVGGNPFLPSLNIITNGSPEQYENIANLLEGDEYGNLIEKVDFSEKRDTIEKVFSITSGLSRFGLLMGALLALTAAFVVFNTIKLVIENSKEEIATMKIVGAANWFIRAPFVIEGALFGIAAFLFCFFATVLIVFFLSRGLSVILPGFSLLAYYMHSLWVIALIQLVSGVGLGVISSYVVVRKYLKI